MQQISPPQLSLWLQENLAGNRAKPQLLDVREPWDAAWAQQVDPAMPVY